MSVKTYGRWGKKKKRERKKQSKTLDTDWTRTGHGHWNLEGAGEDVRSLGQIEDAAGADGGDVADVT